MKKKIAVFTTGLMMFSTVAYAQGSLAKPDFNRSQTKLHTMLQQNHLNKKLTEKKLDKQYKAHDNVRVIIELNDKPAIEQAKQQNLKYSTMSVSQKEKLNDKLLEKHKQVKEKIARKKVKMKYKESFTAIYNGFSAETEYKNIKEIEKLPEVKSVHIANEYKRPVEKAKAEKPDMIYSKDLIGAKEEWKNYGYTGKGTVVAVIDTGIDYTHKDMKLDSTKNEKLTKAKVESLIKSKNLKGKFYTDKVPYGYNYFDKNDEVRDLGPGASMHGMHVAGTVGANGDEEHGNGIKGVAPDAQLLAMKVFSNDQSFGSTWGDIYIKAIDDAITLGADVINMSLGSPASFVDKTDPEQQAITNAVNNGILCSISAGNEDTFAEGYETYTSNPDIGLVGAPSVTNESLSVASLENTKIMLKGMQVSVDGQDQGYLAYKQTESPNAAKTLGSGKQEVVFVGDGQPANYEGKDVKGKVVLAVRTGSYFYADIQKTAEEHGAAAVLIRGAIAHGDYVNPSLKNPTIPVLTLSLKDGDDLAASLQADKKVEVVFDDSNKAVDNSAAGQMSSFTSWGVTPNLDFKPEITAPGGQIYSTLNNNQYGVMSGTSMAAPHVSGGAALMLERVDKDFKFKGADRVKMAKNILMNTSKPQYDHGKNNEQLHNTTLFYSPRREGAGLMNLEDAMQTPVVVTESKSGDAKAALKQVGQSFDFTLNLKNYSAKDAEYNVLGTVQSDLADNEGNNYKEAVGIYKKGSVGKEYTGEFPISFEVNGKKAASVKVPAKGTAKVKVKVILKDTVDGVNQKSLDELYPNGYFVEGFVRFLDKNGKNSPLSVPYIGFKGEWDKAPILDGMSYEDDTYYGMAGLVTEDGKAEDGSTKYSYLGKNALDPKAGVDPEHVGFSPNGDGKYDTILPQLTFLRNAKHVEYRIVDSHKKSLVKLATSEDVTKNYKPAESPYNLVTDATWDGKVKGEKVQDGKYYYEVKSVIDYPKAKWQTKYIPFIVDTKAPEVSGTVDYSTGKVSWKTKENGSGVSYYDIKVDGKSVLDKPLAGSETSYTLKDLSPKAKVEVVAYDYAGNVTNSPMGDVNDHTIPYITVDTPEGLSAVNNKKVVVSGHLTDESQMASFTINGIPVKLVWDNEKKQYNFNKTLTYKTDGVKAIEFKAQDASGNKIDFKREYFLDSTAPTIKVSAPKSVSSKTKTANVKITLTDNFSEMRFVFNGDEEYRHYFKEPYVMKTFTKTITKKVSLKTGTNKYLLELRDLGGNITKKTFTITRKK
ncbi:S8 family serine peptidase [Fictibacillus sp. Mic-4]|uniref:S8 family serine peptidase n=1 Tax=Fictibacillus sp. Mic-4 TaxID=3132826 RepID=UPI003CED097C